MKIKTSELVGAALDWVVAKAVEQDVGIYANSVFRVDPESDIGEPEQYSPSTNWSQGGPLRDQFKVSVFESVETGRSQAFITTERKAVKQFPWQWSELGPTALIAICRAVVSCKLGDEVEVPDVLVGAV